MNHRSFADWVTISVYIYRNGKKRVGLITASEQTARAVHPAIAGNFRCRGASSCYLFRSFYERASVLLPRLCGSSKAAIAGYFRCWGASTVNSRYLDFGYLE